MHIFKWLQAPNDTIFRVGFVFVAFLHLFRSFSPQVDCCGTTKQSLVRLLFGRCENSGTSGILAPWLCRFGTTVMVGSKSYPSGV